MKHFIGALLLILVGPLCLAQSLEQRIVVENDYRLRVKNIIEKIDPAAIVQVKLDLKTVVAENLPGMGFGAEVTPMDLSGQLNKQSINKVSVRVITQVETVPEWIKDEIKLAIGSDIKSEITIQKAKGTIADPNLEMRKFTMDTAKNAMQGITNLKWGLYAFSGGLGFLLAVISLILGRFASRLEKSMSKVVEEKIVPAMGSGSRGSVATLSESAKDNRNSGSGTAAPMASASGVKELADLPIETVVTLFNDCYWTQSDGYANYLWSQLKQDQRQAVIESGTVERKYFSHFLHVPAENLNYHADARYLMLAREFENMDQQDLANWVMENPKQFRRITPLRWDLLPLNLEARLQFLDMPEENERRAPPVKVPNPSPRRALREKIQIKKLSALDEEFVWENPQKVPAESRKELASLVWLGLCDEKTIATVLSEVDARQLATAWIGPAPVLEKLKSTLPAKKQEMLSHFLKSTTPTRNSDIFTYLVQSGILALENSAPADSSENQAA